MIRENCFPIGCVRFFIALPLFNKEEDACENDFERWIYTLKNMETLKRMPFKARKAVFEKLEEVADVASLLVKRSGDAMKIV